MARKTRKEQTPGLWGDDFLASLTQPPITKPSRVWRDPTLMDEQWDGICAVGQDLLVSAAAGSGKTRVLAERCVHLVCDAPTPYQCDLEELLVVTFTEKAAIEMKSRIIGALRKRCATGPNPRIFRQLALAEQAQVSTLHSFCTRLLRQHFHRVGLDPAFTVTDAEEAWLTKLHVVREIFNERYETDRAGHFQALVDSYAGGDDESLIHHVIGLREMLCSLVDPRKWLQETRDRLSEAAESGLDSALGTELSKHLKTQLEALRERVVAAIDLCSRLFGGYPMYVGPLSDGLKELDAWRDLLRTKDIDAVSDAVKCFQFQRRLKPVSSGTPDKETAKAAIDAVREEFNTGIWRGTLRFTSDEWSDGMERVLPHAHALLSLAEEFGQRYAQRKKAARQLDFSDLEHFALKVLRDESHPDLAPSPTARLYHRLFKHVLVDEYQDINELQDAILTLLSHECLPERSAGDNWPNLFCVGDVKQSIYGFRLADPNRFLARRERYRQDGAERRVIDLKANFRSRSPLLDAINGVFKRLMTEASCGIDYDRSQELTEGQNYPQCDVPCFTGSPIELHLLPDKLESKDENNGDTGPSEESSSSAEQPTEGDALELERTEREAIFIAHQIQQLLGQAGAPRMHVMERANNELRPRPARYGDIVVLLRSIKFKAEQFGRILARFGIPTHCQNSTGYFESVEVRDMLALLALLDNQRQDLPLAAVLRSPISGLINAEEALAKVRLRYGVRERSVTFHDAVVSYSKEQEDDLAAQLREFLAHLDAWRRAAQRRPLAEAVWSIYEETGYLAYVSGLADGDQRVANLLHLHELVGRFASFQQQGLRRFLDYLESVRDESDTGEPSIASEGEDVVRIMSVHASKGLEFPIVIIPDLGKKINLSDSQGMILFDRHGGLGMKVVEEERLICYPSLAFTLVQDRRHRQAMAEELRVLYVAMTRAREHLVLVGTCRGEVELRWRDRWDDHAGPLPTDAVLGARNVLEWLGPVAACSSSGTQAIRMRTYATNEVGAWILPGAGKQEMPRLATCAARAPLAPAPASDAAAEAVIGRLSFRYPHEAMASRLAVQSVTQAAKAPASPISKTLSMPVFVSGSASMVSATDLGTATHAVLQHLDFSRPLNESDLSAQINELLARRMLDPTAASLVDRDAIRWFLETDVGQLLRANEPLLKRELPVYFNAPLDEPGGAPTFDPASPLDQAMMRGRLDVFLALHKGGVIVDYKTDAVDAAAVPLRAVQYQGQIDHYRRAMRAITGIPVTRACLIFLRPRVIWEENDK